MTFQSHGNETFDLFIVLISFVVDLVCMQIMPRYKIQDFVFILAFLLPWRVIRVVNMFPTTLIAKVGIRHLVFPTTLIAKVGIRHLVFPTTLIAKVDIRHLVFSTTLIAKVGIRHLVFPTTLIAKVGIRHLVFPTTLIGKVDIRHLVFSTTLIAKVGIRHLVFPTTLIAKVDIRHLVFSTTLIAKVGIRHLMFPTTLIAKVDIRHLVFSTTLIAKVGIRHLVFSTTLIAKVDIRHLVFPTTLIAKVDIRHLVFSTTLIAKVDIRHLVFSTTLIAKVDIRHLVFPTTLIAKAQCNALKRLCFNEGIGESKVDQILMVEECIVNKAGKSKCKIKIDNSSVILLNDKSDFPRLSPRPSLLNLAADKLGRRKSMLPQCISGGDKEIHPNNSKDSLTKGIMKQRARSNSESGRGTLSSPDEGSANKNLLGEEKYYGGLNTPIIVNRKSSLSSPIMASHVRNILNSLEDKCNQMNGSCNRAGGGRGSIDSESIAEEPVKTWNRRVQSIDESSTEGITISCSRRASLQPQQCVDEADDDDGYVILPAAGSVASKKSARSSLKKTIVISAPDCSTQQGHRFSIPTTIQIDPPSNNSNYSLSSSSSNSDCGGYRNSYNEKQSSPLKANITPVVVSPSLKTPLKDDSLLTHFTNPAPNIVSTTTDCPAVLDQMPACASCASQPGSKSMYTVSCDRKESCSSQGSGQSVSSVNNLKPKTLRTPSDIENENNLTLTESSDACESKSNEDCTRNTSIEEIEDDLGESDSLVSISEKDGAVVSGSSLVHHHNVTLHNTSDYCHEGMDSSDTLHSQSPLSSDSDKTNVDDVTRRSGELTSFIVNAVDQDLNSDSTSNLLS
ncbi:hypothetical protein Btru_061612 [Bulinus truncatus]|nr:hypothetical protein Btru_061612 [Bulinus truncatus]